MLQKPISAKIEWVLLMLFLLLTFQGCKPDTSASTSETEAYLADYESPAGGKWGFVDKTGALRIQPLYDEVNQYSEGLAAVNQKGKWGYIDLEGNQVIPTLYKSAWAFHEHKARVKPFEGSDGFLNTAGTLLSSTEWSAAGDFSEGMALVQIGSLFGYIDTTGQLVIRAVYSGGQPFHHGLAIIEKEEKSGVINSKGEQIIPASFYRISFHLPELIFLCKNDKDAFAYNTNGMLIAQVENATMTAIAGDMIALSKDGNALFYSIQEGKVKSSDLYIKLVYLGEQRWSGKKEEGYFLLDDAGKQITSVPYKQINQFKEGIAVYAKDEGWGYLNVKGEELTGNEFKLAWDYKENVARAASDQGIAFIDKEQKIAFYPPPGTLDMRDFSQGLAPIQIAR